MTDFAFPKPVRAPRPPKPPKRKNRLRAKSRGVSRGPSKTAHARRTREWGRMAFVRTLPCAVSMAYCIVAGNRPGAPLPGPCSGHIECMHLGDRAGWRRCPDAETAPGCRAHHRDIDGQVGGRGKWYVALGREGQRAFRDELASMASDAWESLGVAGRAHWDELAAASRAEQRCA